MLKDRLKAHLIHSPLLSKAMFSAYHLWNGAEVARESDRRAHLDPWDVTALAAPMPYGPKEWVIDNNLYGHVEALRHYAGATGHLRAYLEHGLFWARTIHRDERQWWVPRILTLSSERKQLIEAEIPGKKAVALGPYIHYATPVWEAQRVEAVKEQMGRVLLVFPSHATRGVGKQFDMAVWLDAIRAVAKDYDTVLVSLYFLDALKPGTVEAYRKAGYRVVTSGHKFDRFFIRRQRMLLEWADMTMGNEMGTHVGYCRYLGKPHYLVQQEVTWLEEEKGQLHRLRQQGGADNFDEIYAEMEVGKALFPRFPSEAIQAEQDRWVAQKWGFAEVKSPEAIASLFG